MRYTEIVDTPEHAREFMELNKIEQKDIIGIIVVWEEEDD